MVIYGKKRVRIKNFQGGYKRYRSPLVFNAKKRSSSRFNFKISALPKIPLRPAIYFIVMTILIFIFFFSKNFKIYDVMVEGNHLVSTERINSYVPVGKNIFLFNISKVKKEIKNDNSEISDVQIYRGIPDAIKVVVLEYDNKLIWQSGENKFLVSSQGKLTKKIESSENFNLPLVVDSKNIPVNVRDDIVSSHFISFTQNIFDNFFATTNIKPTYFEVPETTFDLYLHTETGFYVKFNTMRSSAKQLDNLKKVLVEKRPDIHDYVDLRIDGWAYYK